MKLGIIRGATVLFIVGLLSSVLAESRDPEKWVLERANPLWCAEHARGKYNIDISVRTDYTLITVLAGEKQVYSFKGHEHSVFGIIDDKLFYALYDNSAQGGIVVAVKLTSGEELWRVRLQATPVQFHSRYFNQMNLVADSDTITVWGHETFGDYQETLRTADGSLVNHRALDRVNE
jgi:hypothetical protein